MIRSLGNDVGGLLTGPHVPRLRRVRQRARVDRDQRALYRSVPVSPRPRAAPSRLAWLALLALAACGGPPRHAVTSAPTSAPVAVSAPAAPAPHCQPDLDAGCGADPESARAFVADVEDHLRALWVARDRANWVNENFITDDTEELAAAGEEATAAYVGEAIGRSKRFDPIRAQLPQDVARKLYLLSLAQTIPSPSDPRERSELAGIEAWMTGAYGKGQYCPPPGSPLFKEALKVQARAKSAAPCLHLEDLSRVLAKSRDFAELVLAWRGWHATAAPMKDRYARYVELANEGAKEIGFDDVGALWRAGYDMSPADFEAEIERLWADVKPLYDELHCYVRARLQAKYGKDRVPDHAPIPAQLLGNMWAQEWNNIADLVTPYPAEPSLDVSRALEAGRWDAVKMVKQGERFFTGLGFDPLPKTFWERSLFTRPRDREVVCHASAWDVTWSGDLRVKVCLEPSEEDFVTIHHELGHDFYFQRYERLPILFQQGANDGFHEAIGDTIALSVTPAYLRGLGLLPAASPRRGAAGIGRSRAHQSANEDGAREDRVPSVRAPHRQVAVGRVLGEGPTRRLQRRVVEAQGEVPGRDRARLPHRRRLRSRREVPRRIEHALRAVLPRAHLPVSVPSRPLPGGGRHRASLRVLDPRQQEGRRAPDDDALSRRHPPVARCARGDRRRAYGERGADARVLRAAPEVARGSEQGATVRLVKI